MNFAGNRLVSVTNPSYTAAYTYAADGLRLRAQESNAQYTDRWFQYDGVRPVLEGTLSGDIHSLRSGQALPTTAKYVWEGNTHSTSSGQAYYSPLVYSMLGGTWRYHFYDELGSTRQLMLHASPYTVTDTYSYEAFGNLTGSTGTTPNPYRYVGSLGYYQIYPPQAGGPNLMHLGARYYMPEVGRFLEADPRRDEATGSRGHYVYTDDSPVSHTDPAGLKKSCEERRDWARRQAELELADCYDRATAWGAGEAAACVPACVIGCKKWAKLAYKQCMLYCIPACEAIVGAHVLYIAS